MTDAYKIVPTETYKADIERLEYHIEERELASETPDEDCLFRFQDAIKKGQGILSFAPHTCRRCAESADFRELIVPFGHGGCIILFSIDEAAEQPTVFLLAARDQHELDYR